MLRTALLLPLLFAAPLLAPDHHEQAAPARPLWQCDTTHSNLGFSVPILGGLASVDGKFAGFGVELTYDPEQPTTATLSVSIDAASIDTGIDKRDAHLRTADFFEVETYPTITFVSTSVETDEDGVLHVTGPLSLHGVTKDVVMQVRVVGEQRDEAGGLTALGFTGTLQVNRNDFGIVDAPRGRKGFVGHEIAVTVRLLAFPPQPAGDEDAAGR